jgi:hypothetical protein
MMTLSSLRRRRSSATTTTTTTILLIVFLVVSLYCSYYYYLFYSPKAASGNNSTYQNRLGLHDVNVQEKKAKEKNSNHHHTAVTTSSNNCDTVDEQTHYFSNCKEEEDYADDDDDDDDDGDEDEDDAFFDRSMMPPWMSDYVEFHKRHIVTTHRTQNNKKTKTLKTTGKNVQEYRYQSSISSSKNDNDNGYIQWICHRRESGQQQQQQQHCGGLGDRLYGIVMTLYLALLTNRTLLVQGQDWNVVEATAGAGGNSNNNNNSCGLLAPLEHFLRPAHIQWNAAAFMDDNEHDDATAANDGDDDGDDESVDTIYHVNTLDNRRHVYLQDPCRSIPTRYKRIEIQNNLMTYDDVLFQNTSSQSACWMNLKDDWRKQRHHDDKHDSMDVDNNGTQRLSLFQIGFWTLFRFAPRVYRQADHLRTLAGMTQNEMKNENNNVPTNDNDDNDISHHDDSTTTLSTRSTPPQLRSKSSSRSLFRPYIGVHIRTGQAESWTDPIRHGSSRATLQLFYQCAIKLQHGMHQIHIDIQQQQQQQLQQLQQQEQHQHCFHKYSTTNSSMTTTSSSKNINTNSYHSSTAPLPPLPDIYIASDNAAAKMQIQHWGAAAAAAAAVAADHPQRQEKSKSSNNSIKTLVDMDILHIDKTRVDDLQRNSVVLHHQTDKYDRVVQQAYMNVWAELQILRDASCLVTSRSKFSDLAVELNSHYYPSHRHAGSGRRRRRRRNGGSSQSQSPQQSEQPLPPVYGGFRVCAVPFDDCGNEQVARALQNYKTAAAAAHESLLLPPTPTPQQRPCA